MCSDVNYFYLRLNQQKWPLATENIWLAITPHFMKAIAVKQRMIHQWNRLWTKVRLEILNVTAVFEGIINHIWNPGIQHKWVSERSRQSLLNIKLKG